MDIPTRVGLGGTALFTVAGFAAPLVSWWVSGPIMAVCAVVAGWGFWPLVSSILSLSNPLPWFGKVSLQRAARLAYQHSEGKFVGRAVTRMFQTPEERLSYFVASFLVNDVPMHGAVPPSEAAKPIPSNQRKSLTWIHNTNNLTLVGEKNRPAFVDVYLHGRDLRKHCVYLDGLDNEQAFFGT